ncbi:hypothetical protein SRRS_38900 [Sporomusa rhizae]|uniref:DMT family transporter n=1 Tax=Sporomusa rhizae TaxID=357999 RepID=UPI00352BB6E5
MSPQHIGALLVAASAAGFATLGIFLKFAYAAGANTITILTGRFLLAAICLVLILKYRGISLKIDNKLKTKLFLLGAMGYGSMSMLYALSVMHLPASLAVMLLYTYPAIVSVLSFLMGDEKYSWQKGLSLAICFAGLSLVLGISFDNADIAGITFGLAAALVYSIYIVIGNRLLKNTDSLITTVYVCSSAAIVFVVFGLSTNTLIFNLPVQGWLSIIAIALFATIVGIMSFFAGMSKVGATNASIISTLEPVITALLSVALLDETITPLQIGGGALILGGIIILQLWAGKIVTKKECYQAIEEHHG